MPTITSAIIKDFSRRTKFINTANTTLPICSSIILDFIGGTLKIYKTNTEKSAILTVDKGLQIEGSGRFLIEEKQLLDFCTERGPIVTITQVMVKGEKTVIENGKEKIVPTEIPYINLQCGSAKRKFQTDDIALFPSIPEPDGEVFEIDTELIQAVKTAALFIGNDDTSPWQKHVIMQGAGIFATDQFKMYRYKHTGPLPLYHLPLSIIQALPETGMASLRQVDNTIFCEVGDLLISVRKEETGKVADLNPYMKDEEPENTIIVDKAFIMPILSVAEKCGSKLPEINIQAAPNGINVWAYAQDYDIKDEEDVQAEVNGGIPRTCVNAIFFKHILQPFSGAVTLQNFQGQLKISEGRESVVLYKLIKHQAG